MNKMTIDDGPDPNCPRFVSSEVISDVPKTEIRMLAYVKDSNDECSRVGLIAKDGSGKPLGCHTCCVDPGSNLPNLILLKMATQLLKYAFRFVRNQV